MFVYLVEMPNIEYNTHRREPVVFFKFKRFYEAF